MNLPTLKQGDGSCMKIIFPAKQKKNSPIELLCQKGSQSKVALLY